MCENEKNNSSQYSSPSFSHCNYNPSDTACSSCNYTVEKCGARNCKLCEQLQKSHYFSSTVTGRKYHIRTTENLNCDSSNLIYLLQCNNCSLQYTGETVQVLKQRIRQHRSGALDDSDGKIFYEHFTSGVCNDAGFSVHIIQKLVGDGRINRPNGKRMRDVDGDVTKIRRKIETEWMIELRTVFPYGCNNRCNGKDWSNREEGVQVAGTLFKKLGHFITAAKKRGPKVNRSSLSPTQCLDLIHKSCNHTNIFPTACASCVLNCARVEISKLTKNNGKKLGILLTELIYSGKGDDRFLLQYYDAIVDMINSKFF